MKDIVKIIIAGAALIGIAKNWDKLSEKTCQAVDAAKDKVNSCKKSVKTETEK